MNDIQISTFTSQIDGGIAKTTKPSIARLTPGPEADAAWRRFEDIQTVVISESDVLALGKDPTYAARFPDEHWHLGDSAYMGQLDVVHQIHCLDQLRKRAFLYYYPHYRTAAESQKPEWYWIHLQHCVSILLENLMCIADPGILTLNWIDEADYPFPDFSVNKQCRNFEALMDWQQERAVDTTLLANATKPKAGVVPGEKEWWSLFDAEGMAKFKQHHLQGHHSD